MVHMMKFIRGSYKWESCGSLYLDNGGLVTRAVMSGRGQIVYCVQQGAGDWCYSVHVQTLVEGKSGYGSSV